MKYEIIENKQDGYINICDIKTKQIIYSCSSKEHAELMLSVIKDDYRINDLSNLTKSFADNFFTAKTKVERMEDCLSYILLEMMPTNSDFNNFTFDHYDSSVEIKEANDFVDYSQDIWEFLQNLGFQNSWICYMDESEKYFGTGAFKNYIPERKKKV